jgi:hypothetical protein
MIERRAAPSLRDNLSGTILGTCSTSKVQRPNLARGKTRALGRLEGVQGKIRVERVSAQSLFDLLEVPHGVEAPEVIEKRAALELAEGETSRGRLPTPRAPQPVR